MRVMDLPDWPPSTFSITGTGRGDRVPTHAEQLTIAGIVLVHNDRIEIKCKFETDKDSECTLFVPDRKTAEKMAAIFRANIGNNLLSIGAIEIPAD